MIMSLAPINANLKAPSFISKSSFQYAELVLNEYKSSGYSFDMLGFSGIFSNFQIGASFS